MISIQHVQQTCRDIIEGQLANLEYIADDKIGEACHELCRFYRAAAISALLVAYDIDEFHHMLMRSAYTRIAMLKRICSKGDSQDRFCKISRSDALFDALASRRNDFAKAIADLSPTARMEKYEYEDDFWYSVFMTQLAKRTAESVLVKTANRLEASLNGADPRRHNICVALLSRDQESFDCAFSELLECRTQEIEVMEKSGGRHEYEFSGAKYIFIEGLAILNIADEIGLTTDRRYDLCPSEARMVVAKPFPGNLIPQL